jgi:hypothetical protein
VALALPRTAFAVGESTITSGPPTTTSSTSATFAFTSSERDDTFECRLDGGSFAACTSPRTLDALAEGTHTFSVRAKDAAGAGPGDTEDPPTTYTWTVDTTPETQAPPGPPPPPAPAPPPPGGGTEPAPGPIGGELAAPFLFVSPTQVRTRRPTLPKPPLGRAASLLAPGDPPVSNQNLPDAQKKTEPFQLINRLTMHWTGVPGAVSYDAQAGLVPLPPPKASPNPPSIQWTSLATMTTAREASWVGANKTGRRYCHRVRARNAQLTTSAWRTVCITRPHKASELSAGTGWELEEADGYYLNEYLRGTGDGIVGRAYKGPFKLVGVVATKCNNCGSIRVKLGPANIKTINLQSSKTRKKRVFKIPLQNATSSATHVIRIERVSGTPRVEGIGVAP